MTVYDTYKHCDICTFGATVPQKKFKITVYSKEFSIQLCVVTVQTVHHNMDCFPTDFVFIQHQSPDTNNFKLITCRTSVEQLSPRVWALCWLANQNPFRPWSSTPLSKSELVTVFKWPNRARPVHFSQPIRSLEQLKNTSVCLAKLCTCGLEKGETKIVGGSATAVSCHVTTVLTSLS
jgi:hypothetical protein